MIKIENVFTTIKEAKQAEIIEKKSRFIANIFYVETIEEAEAKITEIKREHYRSKT